MTNTKISNPSITDTLIEIIRKQAKGNNTTVLDKIDDTINWDDIVYPIKERIEDSLIGTSKDYDLETIVKCFVLQTIYELTNKELAVEITDRKSFQKFLNLKYGDTIPKEDTLSFFRELLIEEDLYDDMYNSFYEQLLDSNFHLLKNAERKGVTKYQSADKRSEEKYTQSYYDSGMGKEIEKDEDIRYKLGVQHRVDDTDKLIDEIESINLEDSSGDDNGNNFVDKKINEIEERIKMLYDKKTQNAGISSEDDSDEVSVGEKLKQVDDEIKMINHDPDEIYERTDKIYDKLLQIDEKIGELYDLPKEDTEQKVTEEETDKTEQLDKSEKLLNKLTEIDNRLEQLHDEPVQTSDETLELEEKDVEKESDTNELYEKLTQIDQRLKELYEKPLEAEEKIETEEKVIDELPEEVVSSQASEVDVKDEIEKIDEIIEEVDTEKADESDKGEVYKKLFESFYSQLVDANIVKETEKDVDEPELKDIDIRPVYSKSESISPEDKEVEQEIEDVVKEEETVLDETEKVLESQEFKKRSEEIDEKVKEIEDHYKLLYDKEDLEAKIEEELKEEKIEAPVIEEEVKEEKIITPVILEKIEEKVEEELLEATFKEEEVKVELPEEIKEEAHIETTEERLKKIDEEIKMIYDSSVKKEVVEEEPVLKMVKEEEPELMETVTEEITEEVVEETKTIEVEKPGTLFMQPSAIETEPEVKKTRDNEIDLKKKRKVQIFNDSNLTEDYELGLRFYKLGFKTAFVNMTTDAKDGTISRIATAEYFPNTFWGAVKQRSRWIAGIAFQNWKIHKWKGSLKTKYFLFRDRKSIISALGILLSNIVFAYFVIYLLSITFNFQFSLSVVDKSSVLWYLMLATFFFMVSRLIHRFAFTYNWYGFKYAMFSIVRLPFDNIINIFATARAFKVYNTNKTKVVWDSTDHY